MICNNKTDFSNKLILANKQVANLCKDFANHSSANIKLLKAKMLKLIHSSGFLGNLLRRLTRNRLLLMKSIFRSLTKSLFIQLEKTAASSAFYEGIQKIFGSETTYQI